MKFQNSLFFPQNPTPPPRANIFAQALQDYLQFEPPGDSVYFGWGYKVSANSAMLRIANFAVQMVLFKVFTNAPAKYHAYTTYGFVEHGTATLVEFFVQATTNLDEPQDDGFDSNNDLGDNVNNNELAIVSAATLPQTTKPKEKLAQADERILIQFVFAPNGIVSKDQLDKYMDLSLLWNQCVAAGEEVG